MNTPELEMRQQLDALQSELAARQSTVHFAHMGVSLVFTVIVVGAGLKLLWDSPRLWSLGAAVTLLAVCVAIYAVVQYQRGQAHLRRELDQFRTLKLMRKALRLDDPAALLPS